MPILIKQSKEVSKDLYCTVCARMDLQQERF